MIGKNKTAILFDLDGTIIDSAPGIKRCLRETLKMEGIENPSEDDLRKSVGPPLTATFRDRFHLPVERVEPAIAIYRGLYDNGGIYECELFDGVAECVKALSEAGLTVALTSSKLERACTDLLEHFEIAEYFHEIVGATADNTRETKVEVLEEFFRRCPKHTKADAVLIGDTMFDLEGARKAGVDFIGVSYGYGADVLREEGVLMLDTMHDVQTYFVS